MKTINDRIKIIITSMYGGNATAFAREVNLGASTIHSIIGKKQAVPTFPILSAIYSVVVKYGVCGYWLMTGGGKMTEKNKSIDVVNEVNTLRKLKLSETSIDKNNNHIIIEIKVS